MTLDYFHSKDSLHLSATKLFRDTLHIPFSPLPAGQIQPSDFFGDIKLHTDISHLYAIGIVNDLSKKDEEITIEKARDYDGIIIIAVQLAKALNRSALALIARQVNQSFNSKKIGNPAIVIFRYSNTISIATVERETRTDADWREGMKLRKVSMLKDIDIVKPHAAHERILLELQKNNASTYEEVYNHWIAKLNIKELNKSFFKKIANWYFWAVARSRFPYEYLKSEEKHKDKTDDQLRELANQKAIIRFITRIIFVWFLKEKSLIPHSLFDEKSIGKLLKKFKTADSSDYYKAIIQNLFFATLNRQPDLRDFATDKGFHRNRATDHDLNALYRYESLFRDSNPESIMSLFDSIPFLNGGLFDSMDSKEDKILIDGFSRTKSKQAFMPDELFFSDSADFNSELHTIYQTKKGNYDVKGIFKIFEEYKFTIEENTPLENDIALDPYLLGEIFENLLAYYNPETGTTARKGTGSFYTPQEIVNYMVDQSLIAYINTQLELDLKDFNTIDKLSDKDKFRFVAKLSEIKILDPACGSGAFPMGVLYRMVDLLQTLDTDNKLWKQVQHDRIIGDKIKELQKDKDAILSLSDTEVRKKATQAVEDRLLELENVFNNEYYFDDYARKLYIIQNCIYGVDIQDMAIQISKLRFFLSLIIDQENKDIQPLPNLETKFVVANTLIGIDLPEFKIFGQEDKSVDTFKSIKDQIKEVRKQHFSATDRKSKLQIKAKDEALRKKLSVAIAESYSVFSEVDLASYEDEYIRTLAELEEARKLPDMVQENIKLDIFGGQIVEKISIRKKKISELKTKLQQLEISINNIASDTQANEIKRQADRIASWDIYNQNAQADWFDPDWMFGISDGFDVVIGNPPYGATKSESDKKYYLSKFNSAKSITNIQKGSTDTFAIFIEKGFNLLRENGNLIYIVPISITSSDSMTGIHNILESNCSKIIVSSYSVRPQPIFENAMVNTSILFFKKDFQKNTSILSTKMYRKNTNFNIQKLLENLEFINVVDVKLRGRYPKISLDIEKSILKKILGIKSKISDFIVKNEDGAPIFYRTTGGRYFKVITNYSTGSNKEKAIFIEKKYSNCIGAILSSNLYFWFYQIISNNLDLKSYEIEIFGFPSEKLNSNCIVLLEEIYGRYLLDIEYNSKVRETIKYANITSFKEYKISKSKPIIDEIDDLIGSLYGLTSEEVNFIKNYEIEYRLSEEE